MTSPMNKFIPDNPWWKGEEHIRDDADLGRFDSASVKYEPAVPFDLNVDAAYTLRGPRQVGKSTFLKRIIRTLLVDQRVAPRNILYSDVEGAGYTKAAALSTAVAAYITWARSAQSDRSERLYVFLDEITGVKDWGNVVRTLYRQGALTGVCVVATGSHAIDLARGGEIAPGRRGEQTVPHADWILMPVSFRDYVVAHDRTLASQLSSIDIMRPADAYRAASQMQPWGAQISPYFERYLLTGGYPHAMAAEATAGRISAGVYKIYRDAISGQMRRAGHSVPMFREIVAWAADGRLGQEFSWNDVSGETDIGSKDTARRYMEDAALLYLWHVLYRAQSVDNNAAAFRSPKKLYPADPFAWHVLASWIAGHKEPWDKSVERMANPTQRGAFVESVAADHFLRAYGPFARYHRTDAGSSKNEEIDLVVHREDQRGLLEIKYRNSIKTAHRKHLAKYGGGILATVDDVAWHAQDNVAEIPLYLLLAGMQEQVTLYPAPLS